VLLWLDHSGLSHHDRLLLAAAFTVAFACCLRTGEWAPRADRFDPATHFTVANVEWVGSRLSLTLPGSKTDPFRRGTPILVTPNSDAVLCARTRMIAYLEACPAPTSAPLFHLADGKALDYVYAIRWFRNGLSATGEDPTGYSGYSFRRGAATAAAAMGASAHSLQRLGRWRSSAYIRYIDDARDLGDDST
jgi:integrase